MPSTYGFRVRHCHIILCLGDKLQFQHLVQAALTPLDIILRMPEGIISRRILRGGGDNRTLRERQLTAGLSKISLGGRLHPQGILP